MKSNAGRPASRAAFAIGLLTLAALALRLFMLDSKSLWLDEGATAERVLSDWRSLLIVVTTTQVNEALYYVLMHPWTDVMGASEFMLRLPSAIFSAATIPLIYLLGVELYDRRVGFAAALLMTVHAVTLRYAQEARSYAMLMLLVTISALFFIRAIKRPSLANCAIYIAAGVLSVYAHLFGILLLPAEFLALFVLEARSRRRLMVSVLIFGMLAGPACVLAIAGDHGQADWIAAPTLYSYNLLAKMLLGANMMVQFDHTEAAILLLYAIAIVWAVTSAVFRRAAHSAAIVFLVLMAALPIAAAAVASIVKPLLVDRYLLECLPFVVILAAVGITEIPSRVTVYAMLAILTLCGIREDAAYYRYLQKEDWRDAVQYIAQGARPADALIIYGEEGIRPVEYYRRRLDHPENFPQVAYPAWDPLYLTGGGFATTRELQGFNEFLRTAVLEPHDRVWLMLSHDASQVTAPLLYALHQVYPIAGGRTFVGVRVLLFERTPEIYEANPDRSDSLPAPPETVERQLAAPDGSPG
ncbi:MAG: glycosyltransferase family 39 protein [Candidatus Binataceae bacterium]|nr:glycosyltransferase family 39 protein [Candidatus Binataceae bacterium]